MTAEIQLQNGKNRPVIETTLHTVLLLGLGPLGGLHLNWAKHSLDARSGYGLSRQIGVIHERVGEFLASLGNTSILL